MPSLRRVLDAPSDPSPIRSITAWWERYRALAQLERLPIDQAILTGFSADRLGYAFASGYQAALRALVPDLPADRMVSLCVTERGGGHPRAIETRLVAQGDGTYKLTGKKRWATLSSEAGVLLVAASVGPDAAGKNRLKVARVSSDAPGVKRRLMPEAPFTPEVPHDEIDLDSVTVNDADLLPGDGFDRYVRPFRTVEDLHVSAALFSYLIREARYHGLPRSLIERLAGLLVGLRALAEGEPSAPEVHISLAGIMELSRAPLEELDRLWAKTESPEHARWERDRLVLSVASTVRERRRERAWERLVRTDAEEETSIS
jgi:hypothetical protein